MKIPSPVDTVRSLVILVLLLAGTGSSMGQVTLVIQDTTDYLAWPDGIETNLRIAASRGYVSEIHRLIQKGADINSIDEVGASALVYAVANMEDNAVVAILSYHPELDFLTYDSESPMHIAARNGSAGLAELMLRAGADINIKDRYGCTPLHYAAAYGYFTTTDVLIYYGADIEVADSEGTTPLMASVWSGSAPVADLLLQNGANPEARDRSGFTPLLVAAQNSDTLLTRLLLDYGADPSVFNNDRYDIATIAAYTGDTDYTRYLLKSTPWKEARKTEAVDPLLVARENGRTSLLPLYAEYGIKARSGPRIGMAVVGMHTRLSWNDIYTGGSVSLVEPLYRVRVNLGFDLKPFWTKVLVTTDETNYTQYFDKRYLFTAGIGKEFVLTENLFTGRLGLTLNMNAGYMIASEFRGTYRKPESGFIFVPSVMLERTIGSFRFGGGYEYMNTGLHRPGPGWFKLEAAFSVRFSDSGSKLKKIHWF